MIDWFWNWIILGGWIAKRAGRKDGEKGGGWPWYPVLDTAGNPVLNEYAKPKNHFADGEIEIKKNYEPTMGKIAKKWVSKDKDLKAKYCNALKEKGKVSEAISNLKKKDTTISTEYDTLKKEEAGKIPPPVEPKWWYSIIILILALSEIPFNAVAFRPMGEIEILNYLLGFVIGFGLVFLAHLLGEQLKVEKKDAGSYISILTFIIIPLAGLFVVAYMREIHIKALGEEISSKAALWGFWILSLFIFSCAVALSWSQHEGRDDIKTLITNLKKKGKELLEIENELKRKERKEMELERLVENIKNKRIGLFKSIYYKITEYKNTAKWKMTIYRQGFKEGYMKWVKNNNAKMPDSLSQPRDFSEMMEGGPEETRALNTGKENDLDWKCEWENKEQEAIL